MKALPWILPMLLAAPLACAQPAAAATPAAPAQLGLCATCHGRDGYSRIPGAPHLAGQPYAYLVQALNAYRSGQRKVPVMRAATGPLSERDVEALARWYSAQSPCPPGPTP